ncbi:hypothetical protein FNF29_03524 [Cafeteria roenbergensis]|uniref:PIH1 N-terminal domain-containing protein n=1 Tax=Cafeteria roenbergensis TaxID=33653 RepID=A0A5A8CKF0_CAFRO|nr:hypothetical protein FNF29_03524 [Cafeteria roenbergensis]|eukprot:KAA0153004.1 hypothetical protein FNF29_03524 [Cafeteria roenbergensis]
MDGMMKEMQEAARTSRSGTAAAAGGAPPGIASMLGGAAAADGDPEALKKASEFWSYLDTLASRDPRAYAEFLEAQKLDNARMETQEAVDASLGNKKGVFPAPSFVLKLVTEPSAGRPGAPLKSFINVTSHRAVNPPVLPSGVPVVDKEGTEARGAAAQAGEATIPMAAGHVRAMQDSKGKAALVVDVVVHPWTVAHAGKDPAFRRGLIGLITESMLQELGWRQPAPGRPAAEIRAFYKGGVRVPGSKRMEDVVPVKFLVNEEDRPANKTHADCTPTRLPEEEARARVAKSTTDAMTFAAAAAGGEEAASAVEEAVAARATAEAAASAAQRMRSPGDFLKQARSATAGLAGDDAAPSPAIDRAAAPTRPRPAAGASAGPLISVVDEAPAEQAAPRAAGPDGASAPAPATSASTPAPAAPAPSPPSKLSAALIPPAAGSGVVELTLGGVARGVGLTLAVTESTTLRLTLSDRAKALVIRVPQALCDEAAGGKAVLRAAGARVTRTKQGLRVRVPSVPG